MRPELNLNYASFVIEYPPLPPLEGTELSDLFAVIRHTHEFESFRSVNGGAVLESEGVRRVEIDRSKLAFQEAIEGDFESVAESAVALTQTVQSDLHVWQFRVDQVTLRAVVGLGEQHLSAVLQERVLALRREQYAALGNVSLVALRLFGSERGVVPFDWQVEVAPLVADPHFLYLETVIFPNALGGEAESVQNGLRTAYEFLAGNVARFVGTFLPSWQTFEGRRQA